MIKHIRDKCQTFGQEQLLDFITEGETPEEKALLETIHQLDLARINELFTLATTHAQSGTDSSEITPIDPAEVSHLSGAKSSKWWLEALKSMARGEVAVVLLSGGQGSRLGFQKAKGMYSIGLPSGKTQPAALAAA